MIYYEHICIYIYYAYYIYYIYTHFYIFLYIRECCIQLQQRSTYFALELNPLAVQLSSKAYRFHASCASAKQVQDGLVPSDWNFTAAKETMVRHSLRGVLESTCLRIKFSQGLSSHFAFQPYCLVLLVDRLLKAYQS